MEDTWNSSMLTSDLIGFLNIRANSEARRRRVRSANTAAPDAPLN
jgi:hypothetical protein